ncbi:MAG TPA: glycosyltransferase family 4 protein [Verrucomicrobiae bacterium]|nr:glycosyltransferase family 4 protein [Verrucomicrobiae bacterium]
MRVLHVVNTLAGGGAERFVASLAPLLAGHVDRCGVMAIYATPVPDTVANARNLDVIEIGRRKRFDPAFLGRMLSKMRSWRPDVVHTHTHGGTYWGRLAALATGVPAIVRTEHHPCDTFRIPGTALADRALNAATSSIVTFFDEQARFLAAYERFDPRKNCVIPNGIAHAPPPGPADAARARDRLEIASQTYAIFVLGSLYRPKNPRLAVDALAHLDSSHRERVRLFFVGDGVSRLELQSLVRERKLGDRITFLGFRSDAVELLPAADLLLMPSLSEGMPLAVIEAMSARVPVLSTPWRGVNDMLHGGRLGAIAADFRPETIAQCMRAIMDDPDGARQTAQLAQTVARTEYDIARAAAQHGELYHSLRVNRSAA